MSLEVCACTGSTTMDHNGLLIALFLRSTNGPAPCPRFRTLDIQWEYGVDIGEPGHLVDFAEKNGRGQSF